MDERIEIENAFRRLEARRDCPVAHAWVPLYRTGRATMVETVKEAMTHYADENDRLRKRLAWHMERCSRPQMVVKDSEMTIADAAFDMPEDE